MRSLLSRTPLSSTTARTILIKIHLWRRMEMFHCLFSVILKLFARLFTSVPWLFVASFSLHRKSHSIQIDCYIVHRAHNTFVRTKRQSRALTHTRAYIVRCECARMFLLLNSICVRIFEWRCKFWKRPSHMIIIMCSIYYSLLKFSEHISVGRRGAEHAMHTQSSIQLKI